MSEERIYLEGELHLSLETVAEVYDVEVIWLQEVADAGLIGTGFHTGPRPCIAAVRLDHVATIVRLRRVIGLDVEAIRLALDHARGPRR